MLCYNLTQESALGPVPFSLTAFWGETQESNLIQRGKKLRENANTFEANAFDGRTLEKYYLGKLEELLMWLNLDSITVL